MVPLLILTKEAGLVDGQAQQQQRSNVEAARMEEGIRRVGQILVGTDDLIKKMNGEIEELKRTAVNLGRVFNGRDFTATAKMELSRIKYKIQLKSSLVANLVQKETLLEAAKTTATHCLMNYQINQQLKDSKISELIQTPEDKSSDARITFDALQSTMEKLLDDGDTVDMSKEHVTDFTSSTAEMNDSDIRTLVDGWASELGSSSETKKDISQKPVSVKQEMTIETKEKTGATNQTQNSQLGTMKQDQGSSTMRRIPQGTSMMRRKPTDTTVVNE